MFTLSFRSCQQTCCETSRCNNHTISEIQRQATDLTTDVETTTTTTMSPLIAVQTGNLQMLANVYVVTKMCNHLNSSH